MAILLAGQPQPRLRHPSRQQPRLSAVPLQWAFPATWHGFRAQQLKDVRYQLSYTITPKSDSVSGHEELRFVQNADDRGILPEWLDFREGSISSLTVNGQPASTEIQNGHVELPAKLLKLDENVVVIDFKAPVAPAGKAITALKTKTMAANTSTRCLFRWMPTWRFRVLISRI